MKIDTQFSIFMVNKPGVLANALSSFADEKINIVAMTMTDSVEHGVMRVVFEEPDQARDVLDHLNMPYNETEVIKLTLSNNPGALAKITKKLSKNHINISYAYVTAGAKGGKTTGILKVGDVKKALKVLKKGSKGSKEKKVKKVDKSIRRSGK